MKRKTGESLSFRLKNNTSPADKHTGNRSSPVLSRVFVLLKERKVGSPLLENSSYMRFSFKQIMPIRTLVVSRGEEEEEQEVVDGKSDEDHVHSEGAYNHRRHRISKSSFVSAIRKTLGKYSPTSRTHSPMPTRSSVSFLSFSLASLPGYFTSSLPHIHIYTHTIFYSLHLPFLPFLLFLLLIKWTNSIKCTRS